MISHLKTADQYGVTDKSPTAHIRREGDNRATAYCGKSIIGEVPTGKNAWRDSLGYHKGQHCIKCSAVYRATWPGAYALTYDF